MLQFSQRILELMEDENVIIMMSDMAHFHIDCYVNKQNCRCQGADANPRDLHQRSTTGLCRVTIVTKGRHYDTMWFQQDNCTYRYIALFIQVV